MPKCSTHYLVAIIISYKYALCWPERNLTCILSRFRQGFRLSEPEKDASPEMLCKDANTLGPAMDIMFINRRKLRNRA